MGAHSRNERAVEYYPPVTVVLLGEPVAFARTRVSKTGAHFTPAKQRNTMAALRLAAQQVMREQGVKMFTAVVRMDLRAEFPIPKNMTKRDRPFALNGTIRPGKRPDIDNLYKLAADALNMVLFRDDALIVEARILKCYSDQPKLVITVRPIAPVHHLAFVARGLTNDTMDDMVDAASR